MKFSEVVAQTLAWLQREERVSYRALKREFNLDKDYLEDLKEELLFSHPEIADEDSRGLVWAGEDRLESSVQRLESDGKERAATVQTLDPRPTDPRRDAAERRHLTVLFCDLVDSTALSARLDPEEYREVVRAYQATCIAVIRRYEGHFAQPLGDGLLVYFGYPSAHEDDAQRAIRTGLEILEALPQVPVLQPHGVCVRIGVHTGLVVIREIGSSERPEMLALGETPNLAARLQGLAMPNTVVVSEATQRLVTGLFDCADLGLHSLKGFSIAVRVYRAKGKATPAAAWTWRAARA